MKKILSFLFAGLIAFAAVSCYPDDIAVFDSSKATAPVIGSYELGAKALTISYTPGKFNAGFNDKMAVNHSFIIKSVDGKSVSKTVSAASKDNVMSVSVSALNNMFLGMGYVEDDVVSFDAVIRATMQNPAQDNGRNGFVDSKETVSITGFVITLPKGSPYQDYTETSPFSVIGSLSAYEITWDGDLEMWMTPDGNQHVAKCVTINAGDEFKFRKDQDWAVNYGGDFGGLDNAFAVSQDGPNIVAPAGLYDLWLDLAAGTATLTEAYQAYPDHKDASNWTVIGSLAEYGMSWDGDLLMVTDGTTHIAQGIKITASDEFKFRQDKSWDVNLGGPFGGVGNEFTVTQGGDNIVVGVEGIYDLIVNPGAGTAQVVETLGGGKSGKIGGDEPEPEPTYQGWGIIGDFNGWGGDAAMTENNGVWTGFFTNTENGAFKFRKDADWGENLGAAGDVEPYMVTFGEPVAAVANGKNLGAPAGFYQAILDLSDASAPTITIKEGNVYSLIGSVNGSSWDKDIELTEKDGVWTSPVVTINGKFKIRHNFSWADEDTYGLASADDPTKVGEAMTLSQPGSDMNLEEGDYKVQFTPATKEVIISSVAFPEQLYMIGDEFGGWDWGSDGVVEMTPVVHQPSWGAEAEAQFWTVRYFTANKGFKFNSKKAWGGDFWGLTTNDGFVEAGGNCTVTEDGFYLVHVDLKREMVHVEPARVYGIGNCFGGWDAAMEDALFQTEGNTLQIKAAAEGELRMYVESAISTSDWWTREFIILDGVIDYRGDDEGQGDQPRVNVQKGQVISLDFNAGTGAITGEGEASDLPETMYIIGEGVGGWDWEANAVDMIPVNGKAGQFWAIRYIEAGKDFKFNSQKAWGGDFYTLGDEDSGFSTHETNCVMDESGVYMIYVDFDNKKITMEKAQVYGIGDCFGGWDEKMEGALFNEVDGKLVGTTAAAGNIRLYAASSAATSDWWTREFVFYDGKIAYRGTGGEQQPVSVEAGKKVTLDFNAGTATVE